MVEGVYAGAETTVQAEYLTSGMEWNQPTIHKPLKDEYVPATALDPGQAPYKSWKTRLAFVGSKKGFLQEVIFFAWIFCFYILYIVCCKN